MINVVDLQRQLDSELVNALSALLSMREYNPDDAFVAFPELSPNKTTHARPLPRALIATPITTANHNRQPPEVMAAPITTADHKAPTTSTDHERCWQPRPRAPTTTTKSASADHEQ